MLRILYKYNGLTEFYISRKLNNDQSHTFLSFPFFRRGNRNQRTCRVCWSHGSQVEARCLSAAAVHALSALAAGDGLETIFPPSIKKIVIKHIYNKIYHFNYF